MNATKGWVIAAVVVLIATTSIKGVHTGKWEFSSVLGAAGVGVALFGMGMIHEELAKLFAILIIVTALLVNGLPAFTGMANIKKLK